MPTPKPSSKNITKTTVKKSPVKKTAKTKKPAKKTAKIASKKPAAKKTNSRSGTKFISKGIDTTGMNGDTLVIVESPTKAKTITKFLGKKYDIVASM